MVFLFDHALLMVKPKSKVDQYKVHRRVSHAAISLDCMSAQILVAHTVGASACIRSRRLRYCQACEPCPSGAVGQEQFAARTCRGGQGHQGRFLVDLRAPRAQVLPDHSLGEYVCQPAKMGGTYPEAAGRHARAQQCVRNSDCQRGVLRRCEQGQLCCSFP